MKGPENIFPWSEKKENGFSFHHSVESKKSRPTSEDVGQPTVVALRPHRHRLLNAYLRRSKLESVTRFAFAVDVHFSIVPRLMATPAILEYSRGPLTPF